MFGCSVKNDRMISVHFRGKPFNITVIQVYAPTSNADESEVEWFYEDLQDLSRTNTPKHVLFITVHSSVAQSCLTFCNPMNRSTPGLPVHHQLPEFTQIHGLPCKRTEIILSFLRLHLSTAFQTLLLTMRATPFFLRDSCPQ